MTARTEQLSSPRILAGVPGQIEVLVYQDGDLVDPEAMPAPSVTVRDAAGATVASGEANIVGGDSGRLTFTLTAAQNARPALLTATWTMTIGATEYVIQTTHETVGELLFTLAEARAFDEAALSDASNYPTDTILRGRDLILDAFTQICGFTFGTRYARDVLDGSGCAEIEVREQKVTAVRSIAERTVGSQTFTAYSVDDLADVLVYPTGRLIRETRGSFLTGRRNVAVEYEHGAAPIPLEIREAALRLMRDKLVSSALPDRATSQASEFGAFSLSTAGKSGAWFGIPRVDAVLDRLRRRRPGIA